MTTSQAPFGFVREDHPFHRDARRFGDLLESEPDYSVLRGAEGTVAERKLLRLAPGSRDRLRWLLLSLQNWKPDSRFEAATFVYSASKGRLARYAFPHDRYLPSLGAALARAGTPTVLQYVPRQRAVFIREGEVGKCVRAEELAPAVSRLEAVRRAVSLAQPSFSVARPGAVEASNDVFFQSALPGRPLSEQLGPRNYRDLLRRLGAALRDLHRLQVEGLPRSGSAELIPSIRAHADLVALFRPEHAEAIDRTVSLLLRRVPELERPAFCHGDFRCGHVLVDGDRWSVVDFDGCRLGDPCQDVARLLAFLKHDAQFFRARFTDADADPALLDKAEDVLLEGYEASLEPSRLRWHLLAHELHVLASSFKRDLFDEVAFDRGLRRLRDLGDRLRAAHRWRVAA